MTNALFNIQIPNQGKQRWDQLYGSSQSLLILQTAQQAKQPILVIASDTLAANRLQAELSFFAKSEPNLPIMVFPDWETLPYDNFSPHQDIISQRLATLYQLSQLQQGIIIVPVATLMHHISPREYIINSSFVLQIGDKLDLDVLRQQLEERSYRAVSQVYEHGEFALRGAIFDLFPMGSATPFRIELFDDEVESIRIFDPDNQRTIEKITQVKLLPGREFPLDSDSITRFRQNWHELFPGNPRECPIYQQVSKGIAPAGIEYYLPLFFQSTSSLLNYLPAASLVFHVSDITHAAEQFSAEVAERLQQCNIDYTRPLLASDKLFFSWTQLCEQLKPFTQIQIDTELNKSTRHFTTADLPDLSANHKLKNPLINLQNFLSESDTRALICAETAGRQEALLTLLQQAQLKPMQLESWHNFVASDTNFAITIAPIDRGFQCTEAPLALITETQLFGQHAVQQRRKQTSTTDSDAVIRNLAELSIGDPVVHLDHGVGRYLGLQTLDTANNTAEYLTLEYAGDDKLYVPVSTLHLISRYSGVDIDNAPLHRLGSKQWQKAKSKAAKQARDVAAELLDIYARRASRQGHQYDFSSSDYDTFASSFAFDETADQEQAITQVINDMRANKPMDRLICGDVGFGKTEVAMRAAFIAVSENKQVAVLVPTTLLAQQHYETFRDRFADWPVRIEVISRFRTKKEQENIITQLNEGKIDILIGTHKLLQEQIVFKRLGLLIIDEEHRFGVRQKERFKALRAEVDILTLTATPIPRTLNMAVSGLRELSIIATPPAKRLSIKTFVHSYQKSIVREAILREIMRGGQVFFLHNNVETIERMRNAISELVPEAQVRFAHGQLRERELESIMSDFYHQRFNILVCTTIIETGIDIPTANTIIINDADRFGLAQLHQLRGRVGRSHHQAYAYLLTQADKPLTKDAEKRLQAIAALEDLGIGFTLATHDLEIRGAGELLGNEQSGDIQAIGFTLYTELLERAVNALKEGKELNLDTPLKRGSDIELQIPCLIPDDYLGDVQQRLVLYKRIASADTAAALDELQVEMIDRFGLLPPQVKNLFRVTHLKLQAEQLGIRKIEANAKSGRLEFEQKNTIDPEQLIELVQKQHLNYKFDGPNRLKFIIPQQEVDDRLKFVENLVAKLTPRGDHEKSA